MPKTPRRSLLGHRLDAAQLDVDIPIAPKYKSFPGTREPQSVPAGRRHGIGVKGTRGGKETKEENGRCENSLAGQCNKQKKCSDLPNFQLWFSHNGTCERIATIK